MGNAMYENEDLIDLLPETMNKVAVQLREDAKRWGSTWKHRDVGGQDERISTELLNYIDQYRNGGNPLPYLKIIGLAHIALVRESHSELLKD